MPSDFCSFDTQAELGLFHSGQSSASYRLFGAHPTERDGRNGVVFRVWAPSARAVGVIAVSPSRDDSAVSMDRLDSGVWEAFIPDMQQGEAYKYAVTGRDGITREKSDPYAFYSEVFPKINSRFYNTEEFRWTDGDWIAARRSPYKRPMNIYSLHLGSWRRDADGGILSYKQIAPLLIPYVKGMGYTHIGLLPVMEHTHSGSWGYNTTGYFSATSRYGEPGELMELINLCHEAGIGVILDWTPSGFCPDSHGLSRFDGESLYEYSDPGLSSGAPDGNLRFDYSKPEIRSFLLSSAMFWLRVFHADGLRVNALSSMLFLGENNKNTHGGPENLDALEFIRMLNEEVYREFPHLLMIAEESTAWPTVTKPTYTGGLGFNYKWNTGWTADTLEYVSIDPIFRQHNHNKLTFPMMYSLNENYILVLPHTEVSGGKRSLIEKMHGYYPDKFAGARACLAYMTAHPGKKHIFMGCEFAQFIEWNSNQSLDWHLFDYEMHSKFSNFVKALNLLYLRTRPFWELEDTWSGFNWIETGDYKGNTLSFIRADSEGGEVVCLFNFSPVSRSDYRLGLPRPGLYREALNSDSEEFGGWGQVNGDGVQAQNVPCGSMQWSAQVNLPPYGAVFLIRD